MKMVPTCWFICVPQQREVRWNLICSFGRWLPGCRVFRSRRLQTFTETPNSDMKPLLSRSIISVYTSQKGVGIVTKEGAGFPTEHGLIPHRGKRYVCSAKLQTCCGIHPASYPECILNVSRG
jgi:hypothetical protein